MSNSKNNGTVAPKDTTKKSNSINQKVEEIKNNHKNTSEEDKIYEIMAATKELEETKAQLENIELENAALRANAKHAEQDIKAELEKLKLELLEVKVLKEENEKIKAEFEETNKNAELLKKELENAQKPTHKTAEEKLNRLTKANEISTNLERKKDAYASFKEATEGDEHDMFRVIFECATNNSKFPLGNPEIVKLLTAETRKFMQKSISESEQELLSYQI